jgi:hypothetical protein
MRESLCLQLTFYYLYIVHETCPIDYISLSTLKKTDITKESHSYDIFNHQNGEKSPKIERSKSIPKWSKIMKKNKIKKKNPFHHKQMCIDLIRRNDVLINMHAST